MAKKKITLKNNNGDELYPLTMVQQVEGLQAALDEKLDGSGAIDVVGAINITGTDSTQSKLTFARSLSYVVNTVGKLGIITNGQTLSSGYGVWFSDTGIEPGIYVGNTYNLGSSAYKWRTVYATTFNGTATAVADGCVSTSKIADTAITPEKIQTSIALNGTPSMTVEPTLSSTSQTIASVGLVKNLKIDTRNLLSNSKEMTIDGSALTSGTKMLQKKLPISVEVGDVLTFNCEEMIINAGTDTTHAILLYSGEALASVKYISPTSKTATITVTKASTTPYLYMYAGFSDDSAGKSITYKGATLVKGDKPMLLWQRAEEDLDDVVNYTVMPNLISASDFELGGIADATGNNSATTSAARARSAGYIPVSAPKITLKSWTDGVVFYLQLYKSDKTHIGTSYSSTGWVSSTKYTYTLPAGTAYIRVVMKKLSGANFTASELTTIKIKAENGSKATDWSPTPEDIISGISNAETRSKAHAKDYTNAEIDKIENGQTVAQKANSLYDDDSGTYKNWGEIDSAITSKIGDKFESYASIQYVDNKVASIGTPGNATETGAGIVRAATQVEVAAGHVSDNDPAEMAFVRPETLQSKLSNYPTTTAMTQAINESRQIIYYQSSQPSGGKNGDIWIKP